MTDINGAIPALIDTHHVAQLGAEASKLQSFFVSTDGLGVGLPGSIPVLWDPKHGELVSAREEIERFRLAPSRRKGTATALTLDSFCRLTERHLDPDSAIFATTDWRAPSFTAVINYHKGATDRGGDDAIARHGDHRITYDFPLTDEWKAWLAQDGQAMGQDDFAAFIEERIAELSTATADEAREFEDLFKTKFATPAELIQLSRGLHVHVGQTVKQTRILQSGEAEIVFAEEHTDATGNKLVVPGLFMLSVPVFFQGAAVRIPARLRYRAKGGGIHWFYQLYRADRVVTERVLADLAIAGEATGLPTYEGAPETI